MRGGRGGHVLDESWWRSRQIAELEGAYAEVREVKTLVYELEDMIVERSDYEEVVEGWLQPNPSPTMT